MLLGQNHDLINFSRFLPTIMSNALYLYFGILLILAVWATGQYIAGRIHLIHSPNTTFPRVRSPTIRFHRSSTDFELDAEALPNLPPPAVLRSDVASRGRLA